MEGWFEKTHGKKATDDAATVFAAIGKLYATLTLDEASDLFDGGGNGETAGADFRKALEDPEAAFGDAWKASGCEVVGGELRSSAEDWENRAFSGPISAGRAMLANSSNGPYKPEFEALRALRWQGWLETDGTAVVLDLAERAGMWDAEEFVGEIAARAAMEPNLKEIARDAVVGIGEAICESRGETTEEELVGIFAAVTSAMNGFRSAFTAGWTYEEFRGKIAMADGSSSLEEAVRGVTEGIGRAGSLSAWLSEVADGVAPWNPDDCSFEAGGATFRVRENGRRSPQAGLAVAAAERRERSEARRGISPDREIDVGTDGSVTIRYAPPGRRPR